MINLLFFVISLLMCGVLGGVFLNIWYTLFNTTYRPLRLERHLVEWWWTVGPIFIVLLVAVPTLITLFWGVSASARPLVTVIAVGHQWYWEFQQSVMGGIWQAESYTNVESSEPGAARLMSTDAHFLWPAACPVRLLVTRADVVHNFNLKSLAISLDAVPGRTHSMVLGVPAPGIYTGLCSEVCGPGHYSIALVVEAISLHDFMRVFSN